MSAAIVLKHQAIVGQAPGPHLLVTGGVHGDEFEPMAAIRRLIGHLNSAALNGRVTLIPVVNEPAYRRGTRTAEDGLDLARTCPGSADGTVTQRVALALSALIRAADVYVDLHSGGTRLAVLPLVGYMLHPDRAVLERQRNLAWAFNLPIVWGTDYRLQGRSLSVARDAGVPAIYAEYGGSATCDPAGVEAYVAGCLNVMASLGMLDRQQPASVIQYAVEDDRPDAGHMQTCYPSPRGGFFEPAVKLGDRVRIGQRLGTVSDILGNTVEAVRSHQEGIVLVLATFPRVEAGDSLAVVLETSLSATAFSSGPKSAIVDETL